MRKQLVGLPGYSGTETLPLVWASGIFVATCLCVVLFGDFLPFRSVGAYATQRFFLCISASMLALLSMIFLIRRQEVFNAVKSSFFTIIFALFFLSGLLYENTFRYQYVESVLFFIYFVSCALVGYSLSLSSNLFRILRVSIIVIAVACFFYAAMTLTVYVFAIMDGFSKIDELIPWGFVNIRYWSHIATWLLPLFPVCLFLVKQEGFSIWKCGLVLTSGVWWWILFLSSSRGSFIGLVIGMLVVLFVFGRSSFLWLKQFILLAALGLAFWLVLSFLIPSLVFDEIHLRELKGHTSGRLVLWQEAWVMSLRNFPFGMGSQSWLTHEIFTESYFQSKKFAHPHNMYLFWAAEYGWIILLLFFALCVSVLRTLFNTVKVLVNDRSKVDLQCFVGISASVFSAFTHAGASAVLIAPGSMLIGMFVLTAFCALINFRSVGLRHDQNSEPTSGPIFTKALPYLFIFFLVIGCVKWLIDVNDYYKEMAQDLHFYQSEVSGGEQPRFWLHGNFPRYTTEMPTKYAE